MNELRPYQQDMLEAARPVVRGEWEPTDIQNRPFPKWFQCSNCKTIFGEGITGAIAPEYGNRTWNFCPICGADMRKEVDGNV